MEEYLDSFQQWGKNWASLIPLFSAAIVALTTILVAIFVTKRINRTTKQTEFFLGFTTRFHNIFNAIHALQYDISKNPVEPRVFPDELRKPAAHDLYRQFFGLMFDESFAYQHGFLGRDAFTE
jgi:hypothetical protein